MGSGRGWLAGDWPSTGGGVLNITGGLDCGIPLMAFWQQKRTQNVSEYMLVLALCLVYFAEVSGKFARRRLGARLTL